MNIVINGTEETLPPDRTIADYLTSRELSHETVVVEHNLHVISTSAYHKTILLEGDKVEILRFVGGG